MQCMMNPPSKFNTLDAYSQISRDSTLLKVQPLMRPKRNSFLIFLRNFLEKLKWDLNTDGKLVLIHALLALLSYAKEFHRLRKIVLELLEYRIQGSQLYNHYMFYSHIWVLKNNSILNLD